jgi:2'-5' RNA ligase
VADGAPIFGTFDEAWRWFMDGGELVTIEHQREEFVRGRAQFLAFQVPVGETPIAASIEALQSELADIDGLALMPPELLHISIRGVGFQVITKSRTGDVLRQEVGGIGERARAALRAAPRIDAEVGPINVFPDALILELHPIEPLRAILRALESTGHEDAFPHTVERFLPHVTIATFLDPSAAIELRTRLPGMRERQPLRLAIRRIELARWWFTGHDLAAPPELETVRSYRLP